MKTSAIECDVLILGGGITGLAAAYHLSRSNVDVVLLERDSVGSKASGVNFGGLRTNGREAPEIPLSLRARGFWIELERNIGHRCETDFHGHVEVTNEPEKMAVMERWAEDARQHGLHPEIIGKAGLLRRWPWLNAEVIGGCYMSGDGSANPRLVTPYFAKTVRAMGVKVHEGVEVVELGRSDKGFVAGCLDGRDFRAKRLINATGAWGGRIAEDFGDHTPWDVMAPQMVVTEPLPFRVEVTVDCNVGGRFLYLRQTQRGNLLFGRGPGRWDMESRRAAYVPQNLLNASDAISELVPHLRNAHVIRTWSGVEGKMPDSLPILDVSPNVPGLVHAFGFSGHGFQLGPASGAVAAELVMNGSTTTDISGFRINRFATTSAKSPG